MNERNRLETQLNEVQENLKNFPEGNLLCVRNGNRIKWFKSNGKSPIYIPKANHLLAENLAVKKYYSTLAEELSKEIAILDKCLRHYRQPLNHANSLLDESSAYYELLQSSFQSLPDNLAQWSLAEYDRNLRHPEHLIYKSASGHMVRSKSEIIIANELFTNKIPYRYECGIDFGNMIFYPDFTIMHPKTRKIFYWEHFGMMDNRSYCDNAFNKLKTYSSHGIIPSVNLITTYETADNPIDSVNIHKIISAYFLD